MILSDKDILKKIASGDIVIRSSDNAHTANISASSTDLRLGKVFKIFKPETQAVLDIKNPRNLDKMMELIEVKEGEPFIIHPGDFALGVTMESVKLADDIVGRVEGRSSLGRLGIIVHSTAGFIDAGFEGTITLEMSNINKMPIALYPGMRICQLAFELMTSKAQIPYHAKASSKYQGQILPQESRISADPGI